MSFARWHGRLVRVTRVCGLESKYICGGKGKRGSCTLQCSLSGPDSSSGFPLRSTPRSGWAAFCTSLCSSAARVRPSGIQHLLILGQLRNGGEAPPVLRCSYSSPVCMNLLLSDSSFKNVVLGSFEQMLMTFIWIHKKFCISLKVFSENNSEMYGVRK